MNAVDDQVLQTCNRFVPWLKPRFFSKMKKRGISERYQNTRSGIFFALSGLMMDTKRSRNSGFTLVELMIVVAVIAILASIALPDYLSFQAKAKRSEGLMLLRGYQFAETNYFLNFNTYTDKQPLLDLYGVVDLPSSSQIKFYYVRNLVAPRPDEGYFCLIQGQIDHDPPPDLLILKIGKVSGAEDLLPDGITVLLDDVSTY